MALDTVAVRLHDGSDHTLGQGVSADADDHPLDTVARLARELEVGGWWGCFLRRMRGQLRQLFPTTETARTASLKADASSR